MVREDETVSPEEAARWTRRLAIECNNRAWRLAEAQGRTAAEDEEMLHCAHAAALHWSRVGTELHQARATMLLAHVHALRGRGESAMDYAMQSFTYVASHDSPPGRWRSRTRSSPMRPARPGSASSTGSTTTSRRPSGRALRTRRRGRSSMPRSGAFPCSPWARSAGEPKREPVEGDATVIRYFYDNAGQAAQPAATDPQLPERHQGHRRRGGLRAPAARRRRRRNHAQGRHRRQGSLGARRAGHLQRADPELQASRSSKWRRCSRSSRANKLLDELNKNGFIALYINFDTGKWDLKNDGKATVNEIVDHAEVSARR